ncbi:MAG TPA: HAMP domain-containing sensor histidine kinase [Caulobacteraceae bacterium]
MVTKADADFDTSATDFAVTHPLRPVVLAGVLSLILFSIAVVFCYVVLAPLAPGRILPLAVATSVFVAAWVIADVALILRRPTPSEGVRIWGAIARVIMIGADAMCVWLIWGVLAYLPKPSNEIDFMIMLLLVGNIPTQIICSPENTLVIRIGVISVLGSTVVFLVTRGDRQADLMAAYVFGFACVMFFLSDTVRHTVRETVAARLASDAAAKALERMLAAVAAERDAKTRFISTASHDLGQPLQAASLFFDQMLGARDEAARAKAADGVRRAFASADQLLSHMLSHLRLEADAVQPYPSRVPLSPLIARIAAQYAPAARVAGLSIRPLETRYVLMLDPVLLERALGNLVNNAIQHSGGARVLVAARRHGRAAVRLWVIDDGVGVGRSDARHIFDDYYRGLNSQAAARSGFGLGLSSVRRIAGLMDGEAGLDPRWLKGAAFYLQFPMARRPTITRASSLTIDPSKAPNENLSRL